jgi:hypothetical protein
MATFNRYYKPGEAPTYSDGNISWGDTLHKLSNNPLTYKGIGQASSFTNSSKNTGNWFGEMKPGESQNYDSNITYDGDEPSGKDTKYDSIGTGTSFTNQSKS